MKKKGDRWIDPKQRAKAPIPAGRAGRRVLQRLTGAGHVGRTGPRPGEHWLRALQRQKVLEQSLRRFPTSILVGECPEVHLVADSFPNLWVLSQASRAALLAIPKVGPAKLGKIQKYLEDRRVECVWGEHGGN